MLRIFLLGSFRVERDGLTLAESDWPRRKVKSLCKVLALHPRHQVRIDQAMEWLWPDLDVHAARTNLSRTLHMLRHTLEPELARPADSHYLTLTHETLRLGDAGEVWTDIAAFDDLLVRAWSLPDPLPLLEEAVRLYQGDVLEEDPYEEWTLARRDDVRGLFRR